MADGSLRQETSGGHRPPSTNEERFVPKQGGTGVEGLDIEHVKGVYASLRIRLVVFVLLLS